MFEHQATAQMCDATLLFSLIVLARHLEYESTNGILHTFAVTDPVA